MSGGAPISIPREWMRAECQPQVVALIKSSDASRGWKRSSYFRWLVAVGLPTRKADVDAVIAPPVDPAQRALELH